MELTLALPGALLPMEFPAAQRTQLLADSALPALRKLLGRGRSGGALHLDTPAPGSALECWLARCFAIPAGLNAPYCAALDQAPVAAENCWQVQPVHLHIARDHLVLTDPALLQITPAEAAALHASIEPLFAELQWQLHATQAERWYVQPAAPLQLHAATPAAAIGRNIDIYLPSGSDARPWKRLMNEVQMVWHTHPVNAAREARGELTINSVWLHGGGHHAPVPQQQFDAVHADTLYARALAHASGAEIFAGHSAPRLTHARTLQVDACLQEAWMAQDWYRWREHWQVLEQDFFAPLLFVLDRRILKRLTLVLCGEAQAIEITITPNDLWKFWRSTKLENTLVEHNP